MDKEVKNEIERAKHNLDKLAQALDRVSTDAELRTRLAAKPMETLNELGFQFDEETRKEIMEIFTDQGKGAEDVLGFPSASSVKSGVKSGVKTGVKTGVTGAAGTVVKSGVKSVISFGAEGLAEEAPEKPGKAKPKPAPKKTTRKKKE
jgi:hypothetical protein